jgi:hypothetical protein
VALFFATATAKPTGALSVWRGNGNSAERVRMVNRAMFEKIETQSEREKAIRILARSLYRELRTSGCERREIITLSAELLGQLTSSLHDESEGG